jgi:RNA polymerase sigma-70 factor (ECF subfamily)
MGPVAEGSDDMAQHAATAAPMARPSGGADARGRVLEELYREHQSSLLNFVQRLTLGDRPRAEDIVQETMMRAWRHIEELAPRRETARSWLYTVARRIAIDRVRAQAARPTEVSANRLEWAPVEDQLERTMTSLDMRAALQALNPKHRAVLVRVYFFGGTLEETAVQLGVPVGTVKSRLFYALRALAKRLESSGPGDAPPPSPSAR